MSDITDRDRAGELNAVAPVSLGDALRALPQFVPAESNWADMAARLAGEPGIVRAAAPRRRRFAAWPIGIAAALAMAFVATAVFRPRPAPIPDGDNSAHIAATETAAGASSVHNAAISTNSHEPPQSLASLQTRSRALEQWLRDTSAAAAPQSAQDLAASAEIEDMIGLVDVQLGAAAPADANATLTLWRRRVALLEDLSTLRYSANALNLRNGIAANVAP